MRSLLALLCPISLSLIAQTDNLTHIDPASRAVRQASDVHAIEIYRAGLARTLDFVQAHPHLFPEKKMERRLLTESQKMQVRSTWKTFLDYQLALEALESYHNNYIFLHRKIDRERSFFATYASHVSRYRFALDFIERVERNSELVKVLDEPVAELGLKKGAYDHFRFRFLNVGIAGHFAALSTIYRASRLRALEEAHPSLATGLRQDQERIWKMGRGKGEWLTLANALKITRNLGRSAVFPVQAGISEWMGDTKVHRHHRALISEEQIRAMIPKLQPGDVMLQRREWYLSNVGLPGFWSHAALYVGTPEERRRFFDDSKVQDWIQEQGIERGDLEGLLKQRYPDAYAKALETQELGHRSRVLEAISEGVSFTTMEHSASADSLVVLRPRLSKKELAFALLRAFGYAGRPYDFDFDFQTDTSLVCTELIYKAFEPAPGFKGIPMQSEEIVGRLAIPANSLARQFDAEYGQPSQVWDMILFLDGSEKNKCAVESGLETFRSSWKRPKWHVWIPEKKQAPVKPET